MSAVRVDDITTQAREVALGRTLLTVVAAVFFAIGWIASTAWLALCWCAVAVRAGWRQAQRRDET